MKHLTALLAFAALCTAAETQLVFEGKIGPGKGKHIVLISGDEEYRSEEALPQLARILATHHGFKCTVLFAIDPDGTVNPNRSDNIPGLEALQNADLMIMLARFRDLPDEQMKNIVAYVEAGRPIVALRTSTHAFAFKNHKTYEKWSWNNKGDDWNGGFGRQVLGETWINHHGKHGKQSTRGVIAPGQEKHPILKGIPNEAIWGPTDVYGVRLPLPGDSQALVLGQVLDGMEETSKPAEGPQNNPMMPVAWTRSYKGGRIFTTTMGSSQDLQNDAFRRLLVNATYWAAGLEDKILGKSRVDIVGKYDPHPFGFDKFSKGLKPADFAR
jgi:type 1 glutamine amidotransferase